MALSESRNKFAKTRQRVFLCTYVTRGFAALSVQGTAIQCNGLTLSLQNLQFPGLGSRFAIVVFLSYTYQILTAYPRSRLPHPFHFIIHNHAIILCYV